MASGNRKKKRKIKRRIKRNNDCALIEAAIIEYVKEHPKATQLEITDALGKSRRTVQEAIARLKSEGLLEREGARKNGRWIVKR